MLHDLRYAARVILQGKAWSAMVVLSLALGIGANSTLFSATNGLLLRKLAVDDPDSLVRLRHVGLNQMATDINEYGFITGSEPGRAGSTVSYAIYEELRKANQTLEDLAAGAPLSSVNVVVDGHAEMATAYIATGNYLQLLGVRAVLGRTILPEDDRPGATPVATISTQYWTRRFGSDPSVVGRVIRANNTLVTVVGVLEPGFTGVQRTIGEAPDLTFPLTLDPALNPLAVGPQAKAPRVQQPTYYWLQVIGRCRETWQVRSSRRRGKAWDRTWRRCRPSSRRYQSTRIAPRCRSSLSAPRREASTTTTTQRCDRSRSSAPLSA
jgi:hypothetical protein